MVNVNGYACFPVCIGCRKSEHCAKAFAVPRSETVQVHTVEWAPNRLPYITLPCGCRDIPWPLVHVFATDIWRIDCDIHGPQTLSKDWKKKATKEARSYSDASEQPTAMDIPPF